MLVFPCACGGAGDTTIDIVYDPCTPTRVEVTEASAEEAAAVPGAIALWLDVIDTRMTIEDVGEEAPVLRISFENAAPVFYGIYRDEIGDIVINHQVPHGLDVVIAHEIGHAMGLEHIEGRSSVMNPANLDVIPNAADGEAITALWGSCDSHQAQTW